MNKFFFLLLFATGIAVAGYEGLPKTQKLDEQLKSNLTHQKQWIRHIDGGNAFSATQTLKQQYSFLLENVEERAIALIKLRLATEIEEKIQNVNGQDVNSYMLSYAYWQKFAEELVETCAQSEQAFIKKIDNQNEPLGTYRD